MITVNRALLASVVSPLVIALPIFVAAVVGAKVTYPELHDRVTMSLRDAFESAILSTSSIYLILVAVVMASSLALKHLGLLSRKTLLAVGCVMSLALATLISCDWSETCEATQLLVNLPVFFCITLAASVALIFLWWRLASHPSLKQASRDA
jgi:hypothetical protein